MNKSRVSVPASAANLGPGFDSLGLALELRNTLEMELNDGGLEIDIDGCGVDELPRDEGNLMVRAARRVFECVGEDPPGIRLQVWNRIPLRSGLGSSAAAVVGAIVAANELVGRKLPMDGILRLACDLEGHADNAAAALYGGLVAAATEDDVVLVRSVPISVRRVAVAQPSFGLSTEDMRRALPRQVPLEDAAFNLGHAVLTVEALRSGDYALLHRAMRDRLHEGYRCPHIPSFDRVADAARRAGAAAVALSGAGPSLIAFAPEDHDTIARAMAEAWTSAGVAATALTLDVAARGVTVDEV